MAEALRWAAQSPNGRGDYNHGYGARPAGGEFGRAVSLGRTSSAVDMRQLTNALGAAREGCGEVRAVLLQAAFRPRLPGLTKMVSKLSKEGAWRKALEVFETSEEMGVRPDTALTNSAISACDKGGRWQKALEIFESMDSMHLPRDAITYSATISALAKGKQWHAALQVFDHMQTAGVEADVVTCCSLINALERGGQWQLAEKLFLQMCTVQEEPMTVPPSPLYSTQQADPRLARSQTSPTSVLRALGAGLLTPPATRPPTSGQEQTQAAWSGSGTPPPAASIGILSTAANTPPSSHPATAGDERKDAVENLASAFAHAATLHCDSSGSLPSAPTERSTSGGWLANPFTAMSSSSSSSSAFSGLAASRSSLLHSPSAGLSCFQQIPEGEELVPSQEGGAGAPPEPAQALQSPQPALGAPPPRPFSQSPGPPMGPSRLQRSGSLRRDMGAPHHAEAAAHLRRAMSCFPSVDSGDAAAPGGLASMFAFSHAARVTPNRVCCNALLAAYARAKPPQWQKALHLLQAMWGGGHTLTPDPVTYNTAIKACANAFQLGRATELFREMLQQGVQPNVTTFNTLIAAASDAGNAAALHEIGECLEGAPPDIRTACANSYVSGLVKAGAWDESLSRFSDMLHPGSGVHPSPSTFNTVMTGHMRTGDYLAVRRCFEHMLSSGAAPSIVSYNTLLSALAEMGDWREALTMLGAVLGAAAEGVNANTATFNAVLAALVKGVHTTPPSQHELLASHALQVYQHLQALDSGATADSTTYASMVAIMQTTGYSLQVVALHDIMQTGGHMPDPASAAAIIACAAAVGDVHRAVQLAASQQAQGVSVDPGLLIFVLHACTRLGSWDLAAQLCEISSAVQRAEGAAALYSCVLQAALAAGQYGVMMELLNTMKAVGLEVDPAIAAGVFAAASPLSPARQPSGSTPFGRAPSSPLSPALPLPYTPTPGGGATISPLLRFDSNSLGQISSPSFVPSPSMDKPATPPAPATATPPGVDTPPVARQEEVPGLTLADTNAMLAAMRDTGDVQGSLEVLHNMKLAGINPDAASYHLAIETMVHCGQPHAAVALCSEGHERQALHHYKLPCDQARLVPGAALGNALDLRGCNVEVGVAVVLTWLTLATQLHRQGLVVLDKCVGMVLADSSRLSGGGDATASDGVLQLQEGAAVAALRSELVRTLTTGTSSLPSFQDLVPITLPEDAVSTNRADGCVLEVQTAALYRALS